MLSCLSTITKSIHFIVKSPRNIGLLEYIINKNKAQVVYESMMMMRYTPGVVVHRLQLSNSSRGNVFQPL